MTIDGTSSQDAWQRECLIEISDGTTHVTLHALTETIDIDVGERDLDVVNLCNLGQIPKHGGQGITTVTFEGYAKEAGTAGTGDQTGTGFWDIFAEIPGKDTSEPQTVTLSTERNRMRVVILWTDETTATTADEALASGSKGIRFALADCFCTMIKYSFTDGILKTTLTFKGNAFDKSGAGNIKMESHDATGAGLTALSTYVPGTTKW